METLLNLLFFDHRRGYDALILFTLYLLGASRVGRAIQQLSTISRFSAWIDSAVTFLLRGCRHTKMGWPIWLDGYAYRVCLGCGIKRLFDEETLLCYGRYGYDVRQLAAERALRLAKGSHGLSWLVHEWIKNGH